MACFEHGRVSFRISHCDRICRSVGAHHHASITKRTRVDESDSAERAAAAEVIAGPDRSVPWTATRRSSVKATHEGVRRCSKDRRRAMRRGLRLLGRGGLA